MKKMFYLAVGVCCCLQTVVNIMVKGLVLGQSLMIISTVLYTKTSFVIMYYEVCCCLHIK